MSENPLLPNRKLKELYLQMGRSRTLARKQPSAFPAEAILGGAMMHLEKGDYCFPLPGNTASQTLASEHTSPAAPSAQRLATAAGLALGLKLGGKERLAIAFTATGASTARSEAGWQDALRFAASTYAPLLLICVASAASERASTKDAITWDNLQKLAAPLHLPVIPVDGSDAVAIYRVVQESALRARAGGGPAVLWCVLPTGPRKPADEPLRKLAGWMKSRNIPVPALPRS